MKQYKLLIFDLDGTLLDTIEGIGTAMNRVLLAHGFPLHEIKKYYSFVGNGLKELARVALPHSVSEEDLEIYYQELLAAYEEEYNGGTKLYSGLEKALDSFSEKGYRFAINTNKIDHITQELAKKHLHSWKWEEIIGYVDGKFHKPNPSGVEVILERTGCTKEEVVYIGDSEVDVMTAKNAGIDVIYVAWGFRQGKEIVGEKYYFAKNVKELEEFFNK